MGTRRETREVQILVHEGYERCILFSCQALDMGGGWRISMYGVKFAQAEAADQEGVVPAPNDDDGAILIRETLNRAFGRDFASHVFWVLTRCCSDLGMHLVQPAGIGD